MSTASLSARRASRVRPVLVLLAGLALAPAAPADADVKWYGKATPDRRAFGYMALSPDGSLLTYASGSAHVWAIKGPKADQILPLHSFDFPGEAGAVYAAFTADNRALYVTTLLAVNHDGTTTGWRLYRYDLKTGKGELVRSAGGPERVIALWPDRKEMLVSRKDGADPDAPFALLLTPFDKGEKLIGRFPWFTQVKAATPDRSVVVLDEGGHHAARAALHRLPPGQEPPGAYRKIREDPKLWRLTVLDVPRGKVLGALSVGGWYNACALTPDAKTLVSTAGIWADDNVSFWDVATGALKYTRTVRDTTEAVAVTPDGQVLVATGRTTTRFFRFKTRQFEADWGRGGMNHLLIAPDGRHYVAGSDGPVMSVRRIPDFAP